MSLQDALLTGFWDEMLKIAVSTQMAGFMQSRRGTRPYRVDTLLQRDARMNSAAPASSMGSADTAPESEASDTTEASDLVDKTAQAPQAASLSERTMQGFATARPYVTGAFKAAVPAAIATKYVMGEGPRATRAARIAALAGAGLGAANRGLKDWAEKHQSTAVAQKLLDG